SGRFAWGGNARRMVGGMGAGAAPRAGRSSAGDSTRPCCSRCIRRWRSAGRRYWKPSGDRGLPLRQAHLVLKRVLHVGKFYPPVSGGMERVVETLCRASAGLVESRVLAMNTGGATVEERIDGVEVVRVGTIGAAGSVTIAPAFASRLRRADADLVILHEPNPWALLSYALARPSFPLAVWYHSDVVRHPL